MKACLRTVSMLLLALTSVVSSGCYRRAYVAVPRYYNRPMYYARPVYVPPTYIAPAPAAYAVPPSMYGAPPGQIEVTAPAPVVVGPRPQRVMMLR